MENNREERKKTDPFRVWFAGFNPEFLKRKKIPRKPFERKEENSKERVQNQPPFMAPHVKAAYDQEMKALNYTDALIYGYNTSRFRLGPGQYAARVALTKRLVKRGLTVTEISTIFEISKDTARRLIQRAIRK